MRPKCALWLVPACLPVSLVWGQYARHDLVSDQSGKADFSDPNLTNAWGLASSPTSPFWVANNRSGTSTIYDGHGVATPLVVNIPDGIGGSGAPTGTVFYGGGNFHSMGQNAPRFLWATEDGLITTWDSGTQAIVAVNNSGSGSIYKGLAYGLSGGNDRLFAADFHNGRIDIFDGNLAAQALSFVDPGLPSGYSPFSVAVLNDKVYVSFAVLAMNGADDVPGLGHGIIDVFDTAGIFQSRLVTGGDLNSPWGMAIAPSNFGPLGGALLVGNSGDGLVHAYNATTGAPIGTLMDALNQPIVIDGLHGIEFGNGTPDRPTNTLFFAAGPENGLHGLFGRLDVPSPATVALIGGLMLRRRRRV